VSGNGLRCFGQALLRRQPVGTTGLDVVVETPAGDRRITVAGSTSDLEVEAEVEMGAAERGPSIEGIRIDLGGVQVRAAHSIDFGNPHLVLHVDDPDEVDLAVSGPATESFFAPTGCNVHLVAVVDRSTVRMRTWERGAGLTKACGSGACAAAYVLHAGGLVDDVVEVRMPGGTATVTVGDTVRLAGTATFVDVHSVDLPADDVGVLGNGGPDNG
jgi:diaminopimelate epimerase